MSRIVYFALPGWGDFILQLLSTCTTEVFNEVEAASSTAPNPGRMQMDTGYGVGGWSEELAAAALTS